MGREPDQGRDLRAELIERKRCLREREAWMDLVATAQVPDIRPERLPQTEEAIPEA